MIRIEDLEYIDFNATRKRKHFNLFDRLNHYMTLFFFYRAIKQFNKDNARQQTRRR